MTGTRRCVRWSYFQGRRLRDDLVHAAHVHLQMDLLPEQFVTERTPVFGRHVLATHNVALQVVFQLERARAVLAVELRLHAALVPQVTGQRMLVLVTAAASLWARPLAAVARVAT